MVYITWTHEASCACLSEWGRERSYVWRRASREITAPCQVSCCMSFVSVLLRSKHDQYRGGRCSTPHPRMRPDSRSLWRAWPCHSRSNKWPRQWITSCFVCPGNIQLAWSKLAEAAVELQSWRDACHVWWTVARLIIQILIWASVENINVVSS